MEPPVEPEESECCNSGCNPCIFDVYEQQKKKYKHWQETQHPVHENCLQALKYKPFTLREIIPHTRDSSIYVFECPIEHCQKRVLVEPGQHVLIKGQSHHDDTDFSRPYTPIPWEGLDVRQFALLIKLYPNGDMSRCIETFRVGSVALWRGPYGDYPINYAHKGILMIAQGTGVAPFFAIAKKILENEECETRMKLLYCCRSMRDAHLRKELYMMNDYWNFDYEMFISGARKEEGEQQEEGQCESEEIKSEALEEDLNEIRYNEVVHWERLSEKHIESILNGAHEGEELEELQAFHEWSEVLICGSELFNASVNRLVKALTDKPIHLF